MIPNTFQYQRANSVAEALHLLKKHGEDAKLLAGGHSLLPAMKLRLSAPATLIDIARIAELRFIREEGDAIVIGAASTHHDISRSKLLQAKLPMLCEAAELIGDVQVRNMGTLGGSIAHADPAADWPAPLLAAGAAVRLKSEGGERDVAAKDFFTGFYSTALAHGEIITQVRIPVPPAGARGSYQKFMQPASRFAIVGCAAIGQVRDGRVASLRVAFTGVSEVAFRDTAVEEALAGKAPSKENIQAAADLAAAGVSVMSDHFASEAYRLHLARVYARYALTAALS
jgi:carbon-monoxide dehydrogenase medium subunit